MSTFSYDTFERYKQKGLDARRAGQWDSARIYLLEAARAMLELSKSAQGEELREARRQTSAKLLDLAKDCDKAKSENRKSQTANRKSGSGAEQSSESREDKTPPTGSFAKSRRCDLPMSRGWTM